MCKTKSDAVNTVDVSFGTSPLTSTSGRNSWLGEWGKVNDDVGVSLMVCHVIFTTQQKQLHCLVRLRLRACGKVSDDVGVSYLFTEQHLGETETERVWESQ